MLHNTSSFWGESISNLCIPSQKVIHADRISMSWRHHEELVFIPKITSSPQEPIPTRWVDGMATTEVTPVTNAEPVQKHKVTPGIPGWFN